jgi:trimeric autotransporter adhesin
MQMKWKVMWLALCAGAVPAYSQSITTVAGGGPNNLAPLLSSIGTPSAVIQDSTGDLYIADAKNNRVYKVSAANQLVVFAGTSAAGYSGDGGAATAAELNAPRGLALDSAGDVFIADSGNNVVREVMAASGNIQTVAGNGTAGATGDSELATSAELSAPGGVFVDANGNVFISDTGNNEIREVSATSQSISRIAGTGSAGFTADGAAALSATLRGPVGIFVDANGNIFVADRGNNVVREILAATGNIQTVAGDGTAGGTGDGGLATEAELNGPVGIFVDASGDLFIADANNNLVREVVASSGKIQTVAGNGIAAFTGDGGNAIFAELSAPQSVSADSVGDLFIADTGNSVVRDVVVTSHAIHTIAGNLTQAYSGDGNLATNAALNGASDVALDGGGDIFIADGANEVVREVIAATGLISTIAGRGPNNSTLSGTPATNALLSDPAGVFVDGSGNLFIADRGNNVVRKVTVATGAIQTIAGNGSAGYAGDAGPATSAALSAPASVSEDRFGNLFIVDSGNNVIRRVDAATGIISTVAGNGSAGYSGDGAAATSAELRTPQRVAVDVFGNIYIADSANHVIREVSATNGDISTVAGNGTAGSTGDGGPAQSAELNGPAGVAVDSSGNIFISDTNNHRIRKVSITNGNISTIAGNGTAGFGGDNGAAANSTLNLPKGLGLSATGDLNFADTGNNRVRAITGVAQVPAATLSTAALTFNNQVNGTTSASQSVTVTNSGAATLIVASATTTGPNATDFTATNTCAAPLAPNASCSIAVAFTAGATGTRTASLSIADNAPGSPQQISLSGMGEAPVTLAPGGISFPLQLEGKLSAPQTITVTNNQTVVLNISSISISGTNAGSFAQSNTCGTSIAPGASCAVTVTFNPAAIGANNADLVIAHDAVGSPLVAGLSGTGTTATADLTPASLTFGTAVVFNAIATQSITLTNNGTDALTVASVQVLGSNSADFTETNTCGTSVAIGKSCTITVTFKPFAAGTRVANITVTDGAGNSPQTVTLTGVGIDYSLTTAPNGSVTGTESAGQSTSFALEVAATGGASSTDSVTVALTCSGLPSGALCAINPTSVTATVATPATFSVAIRTTASLPPGERHPGPGPNRFLLIYLLIGVSATWIALMKRRRVSATAVSPRASFSGTIAMVVLLGAAALWGVGCKSNTSSTSTPPGSYDITITGTSGNATRTVTISLTVD